MGETTGGALRRGSDRILGGVCSGLAAYFGVDALLVRIIFVLLALIPPGIGIGVILYLVLWFLMDPPEGTPTSATRTIGDRLRAMGDELREDFRTGFRVQPTGAATPPAPSGTQAVHGRPRGLWFGVILIVLGAYLLIDNLGWLRFVRWDIVGPVVLIAVGLLVLARRR
jgi:phage shock protein C